ncbi:transposase [Nostoc sp. LEGE 12450]|uniref:transposase n=1 Tax=Nostoc sp. LEGE 12450 TaxID=1828643 RepID=UPI001880F3AE|nr:hypothetical protein [Nostoc sp. LEGE 12450]MBE8992297.1 hypothetical protein [Nostoc sp. LEGE 12450]
MILTQLEEFRQAIYDCLGKAKDAVFELMDAVLTSPSIQSFVSLSQSPVFRRRWPSIYAALHDSRPQRRKLMNLLVEEVKTEAQPFLAGDHTFWPRPDAKTLKERTFHWERGVGVGIGQSYSTLAWIPEADGSWALPLRHERITSFETPTSRAAFQLKLVSRQLEKRPLAAYDRGYGNAKFVTIIRVEVIKPAGRHRKFKPLWLAWLGKIMPILDELWHKYLRRFALEHWYRFAKQRLHWTQPQLSSSRAAERWSDLMPLLTWQLWFARVTCIDSPLPWQSTQDKLSPGRVSQAFPLLLAAIGTPAQPPKNRGKSSGRTPGHRPPSRPTYPTVKKRASKKAKAEESLNKADSTAAYFRLIFS